ncbi:MAG: endonuclease III [Candidatus Micrarchaeia archaeon]
MHRDPFRVLISTVLSQRTRDENTALASERLFSIYQTPLEIAHADLKEIEKLIKPSGFYKVKARRIKEISKIISEKYGGKTPENFEELLSLPGVGRKTANCVLAYGFGKDAIAVDTHVHRISNRLGLVKTKKPEETEMELIEKLPKKHWREFNDLLVKFGQSICLPRNPRCGICRVSRFCDYAKKNFVVGVATSVRGCA